MTIPTARLDIINVYGARLRQANSRLGVLQRIEDYPSILPPKDYSTALLSRPECAIPDVPQHSFKVFSNPQMAKSQWDYFYQRAHPYLEKPFTSDEEKARWVTSVRLGHLNHIRTSWHACSAEKMSSEAESLSGYDRFRTILGELGMGLLFFNVHRHGYPLKIPFEQRHLKLSTSSVILTSFDYVKRGTTLLTDESPYLVRILTVAHLIYADEIQSLATQGGSVNVEAGVAVWPEDQSSGAAASSHDLSNQAYKIRKAKALLNWVFDSAFEANLEFVILTDGWRSITFFIHENRNLVVGPTMLPRINRPDCDPSLSDGTSLGQAYIATVFLAWGRKKKNATGTKLFLQQWDGIEAPVDHKNESKRKSKRATAKPAAKKNKKRRGAASKQIQKPLSAMAQSV